MKKWFFLLAVLAVIALNACIDNNEGGVVCTTDYRVLTVALKDSAAKPVVLDSYRIRKISTGETMNFTQEASWFDSVNTPHGVYLLFTDSKMWATSKAGMQFEFSGMKDSVEVIRQDYIIGRDDCHVRLVKGPTEITVK